MAWTQAFLDTFDRANSTTVGNSWSQSISSTSNVTSYGIVSNRFGLTTSPATARNFGINRDTTVGYTRAVEATMVVTPNAAIVYVGRRGASLIWSPYAGYGYLASVAVSTGVVSIVRADSGTGTAIGSGSGVPVAAGTVYRLEHDQDGSLRFYANGTQYASATDTTYMAGSDTNAYGCGLIVQTTNVAARKDGYFDDFRIYEQPAPTGAPIHLFRTTFYSPAIVGS